GGAEVAAVALELVADLSHGAGGIVRRHFDENRRAAGTVALVGDFVILDPLELTRPLLDRPVDVVGGHVLGLGRVDRGAQARIASGVTTAPLGGDRDFPDQAGEHRAAFGVGHRLLTLDLFPFTVAGHRYVR